MHRHRLHDLQEWLRRPGRKPLVLRGARQVGKSTLVRLFCEAEPGLDLLTVDLERRPQLAEAFASRDPAAILNVIEAVSGRSVSPRTLLFLDEIQAAPAAFVSLRYFREEMPELPIVAAGSLLETLLSDSKFPMPVGRIEYLDLGPMTFTEFLRAAGHDRLAQEVETFEWPTGWSGPGPAPERGGREPRLVRVAGNPAPAPERDGPEPQRPPSAPAPPPLHPAVHQRLLDLLRVYQFVGGMPEAVAAYAKSGNLRTVSRVHAGILDTWRDDFPKYAARRDLTRMLRVFNFAARHVGRKVKYSHVSPDDQSATVRRDVDLLAMARVVARVTHSQCSGLPLQADLKERVFKLIFLDVGLMNALCGLGWQTLAAQTETQLINAGADAEQFVGQHLQHLLADRPNRDLTYWLREGRSSNAEVDYVCELAGRIVPIEVKAGRSGALRSLHQFAAEKRTPLAVRFDASPPTPHQIDAPVRRASGPDRVSYTLLSLPLYLIERLPALVAALAARSG